MEIKIGCGSGTLVLAQIILLILKLTNLVNWSWWIICIPSFFLLGICVLTLVLLLIVSHWL